MHRLRGVSYFSMVRYNWFCRHVEKNCGRLVPYVKSVFLFGPDSRLVLGGNLRTNDESLGRNGRSTVIRLDRGAVLETKGRFCVYYGGDIIVFPGGKLVLGSGGCNSDVKIRCTERIEMGRDVFLSHNVTVMDSDAHEISGGRSGMTGPVKIGDHVLVGTHATILKGVTIGDGAVIAANSVVTRDVPENCLAAGVPAKVIRRNIGWR